MPTDPDEYYISTERLAELRAARRLIEECNAELVQRSALRNSDAPFARASD